MALGLNWLYLFLLLMTGMFIVVPLDKIRGFLPFGLVGGFWLAAIIQYIAIDLLKLWRFKAAFLAVKGIPVGVLLSWVPPVIIFRYYWPKFTSWLGRLLYITVFAVGSTIIEYFFVLIGYREYINWHVALTFGLAVIIHSGLGYYLTTQQHKVDS